MDDDAGQAVALGKILIIMYLVEVLAGPRPPDQLARGCQATDGEVWAYLPQRPQSRSAYSPNLRPPLQQYGLVADGGAMASGHQLSILIGVGGQEPEEVHFAQLAFPLIEGGEGAHRGYPVARPYRLDELPLAAPVKPAAARKRQFRPSRRRHKMGDHESGRYGYRTILAVAEVVHPATADWGRLSLRRYS